MEESVWMYFGIIIALIVLGMVISIFSSYNAENDETRTYEGLAQLGSQARIVCESPQGTKLSTAVTLRAGSDLYTLDDRICVGFGKDVRCVPSECTLEQGTLLDLRNTTLFKTHEYRCSVLNNGTLRITCEG